MAQTIYFHDVAVCNLPLISQLSPKPGDTIIICARDLTVTTFSSDYNYILAADTLTYNGSSTISLNGNSNNPSPSVTILAKVINGPINIIITGLAGINGSSGATGGSGFPDAPGMPGDPGTAGTAGQPGGDITIKYLTVPTSQMIVSSTGGKGGIGGTGGRGGPGGMMPGGHIPTWPQGRRYPPGRQGNNGADGADGANGKVLISAVDIKQIWQDIDAEIATWWAAYRVKVGMYLFRKYDTKSLEAAINELKSASLLDATNGAAQFILSQIAQQQIPSGLARDLDLTLDFPALSENLSNEIDKLQLAFAAFQTNANAEDVLGNLSHQLTVTITQLTGQLNSAKLQVQAAQANVAIAQAKDNSLASQISALQQSINNAGGFSFGSIISTVGAVAGAIASIYTGVGAIVTIPNAIETISDDFDTSDSFLDFLHDSDTGQDVKSLGNGLEGIMQTEKGLVNFSKVIADLDNANKDDSNGQLSKLVGLVKEKKIADLRISQANIEVKAATELTNSLTTAVSQANALQSQWDTQTADLDKVSNAMLDLVRLFADKVSENLFISARALEIYQLQSPSVIRFDYGYISPDDDTDLSPAERAGHCAQTLSNIASSFANSADIYNWLNVAEIQGYDVVHPVLPFTIIDPVLLEGFTSGNGLQFSTIESKSASIKVAELKINSVEIILEGAKVTSPVNVWVEHSGHWIMTSRIDGSIVEFNLLPRVEVISCEQKGTGVTGMIPKAPPTVPGPPFSFWGRGALAKWIIYPDQVAEIDLTGLKSISINLNCIGFAKTDAANVAENGVEVREPEIISA